MVMFKRKHISVGSERRQTHRIEFHYPVVVLGVDDKARILDFSPNGFYIEMTAEQKPPVGRYINLALKLPTEKRVLKIKTRVTYTDETGIGCQVADLSPRLNEILERCFNIFNSTLPIE